MPEHLGNGLGGPFSQKVPWLRIFWDSTALDALMRDPFGYVFEMNGGWRSREPAPPLVFGDLYGRVRQFYDVKRTEGLPRDVTLKEALRYANKLAYENELNFVDTFSSSADRGKRSAASLMRSIVWHDAQFGGFDPVKPVAGADGRALTETLFTVPLPFHAPTGEQYHLCGYLDGVIEFMGDKMPREMKHTTNQLTDFYFAGYETSTQIRSYLLIAWLHFTNGEGFQSDLLLDATSLGEMPGKKGDPGTKDKIKKGRKGTKDRVRKGKKGEPDIVIPGRPDEPDTVIPGRPAEPDRPPLPYVEFKRKVFSATRAANDEWLQNLEYWIKSVAERDHAAGLHEPTFERFRAWSPPGQSLFTKKDGTGGSAWKRGMLVDPQMRAAWVRERFAQTDPWNPTVEREKF